MYGQLVSGLFPGEVAVAADALGFGRASAAVRSEALAAMAGPLALEFGPDTTDEYDRQPGSPRDSLVALPAQLALQPSCSGSGAAAPCTEPDAHLWAVAFRDTGLLLGAVEGLLLDPALAAGLAPVTPAANVTIPTHAGRSAPLQCAGGAGGALRPCNMTLRLPAAAAIAPGARLACIALVHANDSGLRAARPLEETAQLLLEAAPLVGLEGNTTVLTCQVRAAQLGSAGSCRQPAKACGREWAGLAVPPTQARDLPGAASLSAQPLEKFGANQLAQI